SIDYRLAPQHPFPAAVEDALAAYLYLIDPPTGPPVDPSNIVIAGDSAGGGLVFALLLAIRDAGLAAPAGAMTLSPWIDLTHSLPSIMTNISTDYLPALGFKHKPSRAVDYHLLPIQAKLQDRMEEDDPELKRVQFYAGNKSLKHPWVSPVYDKRLLRGLPPLLIQTGTAERLNDEAVYAALQASNQFSNTESIAAAAAAAAAATPAMRPTRVELEMYVDQPHVFQILLPTTSSMCAIERLCDFCRRVTSKGDHQTDTKRLLVTTITPDGNVTDTTDELLNTFLDGTKWRMWQARLARTSLRERMNELKAVVARLDQEEQHHATTVDGDSPRV
ncbi:Alpha/Beta hydrolase protein, partial [Dichotomocladium elegans]